MRYAHTFLFMCPDCGFPLAISVVSEYESREPVNAEAFHVGCVYCGRAFKIVVSLAKKHYVEPWPHPDATDDLLAKRI